jgi:hypothetical protein
MLKFTGSLERSFAAGGLGSSPGFDRIGHQRLFIPADRGAWTATGVNGLASASAGTVVEAEGSRDHESQRGDFETLGV